MKKFNVFLQYLIPKRALSRLMGKLAFMKSPACLKNIVIPWFIRRYGVNMAEALEPDYRQYSCFNDFFTRKLALHARTIDAAPQAIISPADGVISEIGIIHQGKLIQAKGHNYTVSALLGESAQQAAAFENGCFATIYLSPKDYHRVHMPFSGHFIQQKHILGDFFSVNHQTTQVIPNLFARNERVVTLFQTSLGKMAVIFVGAMIVGNIVITPKMDTVVEKGEELGYFQLGSTVILLFEPHQMHWENTLKAGSPLQMGTRLGSTKE
jgi:phosphatidylserine decarboxylase